MAQLAASKVAELDVAVSRAVSERDLWRTYAQPKIDEVAQLAVAAEKSRTTADALCGEATQKRQAADEMASVLTALQEQVAAIQDRLDAARATLAQHEQRLAEARSIWTAQEAAIRAAGGRVPVE